MAGGRVEGSEFLLEAADREMGEETGQSGARLEGAFEQRGFDFLNHGVLQHQTENFFAARTADPSVGTAGWTGLEEQVVTRWQW